MSFLFPPLVVSAIAVTLAAATAPCHGTTFLADGYSIRVWQTDDGLPQNMVTTAVQTRDGYLWFGSYSGLARFDGERFRVFDTANTPGLQDRRISSLFEDREGILWIGQESGTITCYRDRFVPFTVPSGNREKVLGFGADRAGRIWALRQMGSLECLSSGERAPSLIEHGHSEVMAWAPGSTGDLWVAENGQAAHLDEGKLRVVQLPPPVRSNYVIGMAAAADGGAWILCDDRIRKWHTGGWAEDLGRFPWPEGSLASALELRDGTLAVGTIYSGVYLVFRDSRPPVHLDKSDGLPQNWVRFLYEDREGTLWAGTGSAGLVSIRKSALSTVAPPDQWRGCTVLSVAPGRNDTLWIGTDGGGLYRFSGGTWEHFGEREGLSNSHVPAVAETPTGDVWVGNFWWGGPYRLAQGRFAPPAELDPKSSPVFALSAARQSGDLLVGNCDGVLELGASGPRWLAQAPNPSAGAVCALIEKADGTIWAGFAEGGLVRISGGSQTRYSRKDGLPSDSIQCIAADEDSEAIWIGTADRGLSRFKDGRFTNLGVEHGLIDNIVGHILDDGRGYFWLSTHHGLQRISKSELDRCASGLIPSISGQVFDQSDGLPTSEFIGGLQAGAIRTADGRLWFACSKGLVCVTPDLIERNTTPPPVLLQSVVIDGEQVPLPSASPDLVLPPDHRRLEFRFAGLSFAVPDKVNFKYRLDGIDQNWVDANARRTAFYSRLPAGSYRFRVIASNNDGVWNTEGAMLAFSVEPFLWQTWWFLTGCVLVATAAIAFLVRKITRKRMQRKIEQAERQHAIERERTRIAQDIHDDIGASLSRIAMLSQPMDSDLPRSDQTTTTLSRIYGTARELTRSLDEIVWAVDPKHDTLDSLADYMGKYAYDFLSAADVRCRLNIPVSVPAWPLTAEFRHNLFLSFKEALNNAVKHSGADEIRVSLELLTDSLKLTVQDNGRGFGPESGEKALSPDRIASGNGLRNMQKRIAHIGGKCELSSQPGMGTTVSFLFKNAPSAAPRTSPA